MKLLTATLTLGTAAALLTGCETPYGTPDRTANGALIGGGVGAASGAAIGSASGHAGEGALIGGAVGVITGGLIGHSMDQQEAARLRAQAPQTYARVEQGQPLAVADVKAMAQAHVSDEVIISQIQNTHTVYHLSAADIIDLHNAGVSERVVQFMVNTPSVAVAAPAPPTAVVQGPPPVPAEPVYVAPGPEYVWIGGEWVWNGHWVWVGGHWGVPPRPHAVWVRAYWVRGPHGYYRVNGYWR